MSFVLQCHQLSRAYMLPSGQRLQVLNALDWQAEAGCVAVVGANGAGKSTLLRLCAGLLAPDAGTVRVLGGDPCATATRHHLALVCPGMRPPQRATPREVLQFVRKVQENTTGKQLTNSWLDELIERFALAPFLDRPSRGLSTGEVQRLELARALLPDPEILLVDEPSTGLDLPGAALMRGMLAGLVNGRRLVVLASHDPLEILAVAQRVVVLRAGGIAWQGTCDQFSDPAQAAKKLEGYLSGNPPELT